MCYEIWSEGCAAASVLAAQRPAFKATSIHNNQRPQLAGFETFLPIGDNKPSQ